MNEFTKTKITVALALIGVAIAAKPIIDSIEGILSFHTKFEVIIFYYAIIISLGLCVYLYAIDFITEKPIVFIHKLSNYFYSLSLVLIFVSIIAIPITTFLPHHIVDVNTSENNENFSMFIVEISYAGLFINISIIITLILSYILSKKINKTEEAKYENSLTEFIVNYLNNKNFTKMSFKRIRKVFGQNLTDEYLQNFVKNNSDIFELYKFQNGLDGLHYTNKYNEEG